ncbi:hypothetical protein C5167_032420 [Papaver somniferum]|uniref:RING-type domain-containing protein n=1 Tax=Papaver somniferum TaxID=3469 RepID=A0A4Y7KAH0_PAPSO|nr:MND1-interacting protein 1-like [Papaver somniferum]RZC69332.1 hypothetical protein C5167_032420 [Papaver somniferum]
MGCTVREKHLRNHRKLRSAIKSDSEQTHPEKHVKPPSSYPELTLKPSEHHHHHHHFDNNGGDQNRNPNPNFDESGWGYCTEDQLEELLLKNLEFLYNEAITKLISLGYDEEHVLKAILHNGHCYGGLDVLTNILNNSVSYLNSGNVDSDEPDSSFIDLKQLEEYSLAGMVCLLQQVRPNLSKGDAMWCLLMSDLHVGRASTMEIPVLPSSNNSTTTTTTSTVTSSKGDGEITASSNPIGIPPGLCRFHGGWGFGAGEVCEFPLSGSYPSSVDVTTVVRDIECPKRFNLTPSMKSLLQRNVTMFAASIRAKSKSSVVSSRVCPSSLSIGDAPVGIPADSEHPSEKHEESRDTQNPDVVSSVLSSLGNLSLDDKPDGGIDSKGEMMMNLAHQIRELEGQVKDRKEWAHQKAMQAARKLSHDLTELKMLRMEREETQRLKKGKQTLEDTTMKKLSEMENALRKASGQVDRANAAVRRLENENAEIKAEMEASKLSASESATTCLEVAKREKKCLKRLLAWEKQKAKLQEEVVEEKKKIFQLQRQLVRIKETQKETEVNWRQEIKAKELVMSQVEEERRSKESAEGSVKRNQEALRRKVEIDFQRHKDDIQRLEQELSRLRASAESIQVNYQTNGDPEMAKPQREINARVLHDLNKLLDSSEKETNFVRVCLICMIDEASVVFLPCAHQVLCANCSNDYGKKGKATCPSCRVQIEQRINVYGASS